MKVLFLAAVVGVLFLAKSLSAVEIEEKKYYELLDAKGNSGFIFPDYLIFDKVGDKLVPRTRSTLLITKEKREVALQKALEAFVNYLLPQGGLPAHANETVTTVTTRQRRQGRIESFKHSFRWTQAKTFVEIEIGVANGTAQESKLYTLSLRPLAPFKDIEFPKIGLPSFYDEERKDFHDKRYLYSEVKESPVAQGLAQKVVSLKQGDSRGTAFFISSEGHLATNSHVVDNFELERRGSANITLGFQENDRVVSQEIEATLLINDPDLDFALIKIEVKNLARKFSYFNINAAPKLGPALLTAGFPRRAKKTAEGHWEDLPAEMTVSWGMITPGVRHFSDHKFASAKAHTSVSEGASGSPMVDPSTGKLVGILHSCPGVKQGLSSLNSGSPTFYSFWSTIENKHHLKDIVSADINEKEN